MAPSCSPCFARDAVTFLEDTLPSMQSHDGGSTRDGDRAPEDCEDLDSFGASRRDMDRRTNEGSMQDFVSMQMKHILKPFLDRLDHLEEETSSHSVDLAKVNQALSSLRTSTQSCSERLAQLSGRVDMASGRVDALATAADEHRKGIESARQDVDILGIEFMKFRKSIEDPVHGALAGLQGSIKDLGRRVAVLEELMNHEESGFEGECRKKFAAVDEVLQSLSRGLDAASTDRQHLRKDIGSTVSFLREARTLTESVQAAQHGLQKSVDGFASREAQLAVQINAWKAQWSKLHPEIQANARDIDALKRRCDHHDSAIHGNNQAQAAQVKEVREFMQAHIDLKGDIHALRSAVTSSSSEIATVRVGLAEAVKFNNNLHTGMEDTRRQLKVHADQIDGLDKRSLIMGTDLTRAKDEIVAARSEHASTCTSVRKLATELENTRDAVQSTKSDLMSTSSHLDNLRMDFGKAKKTVERLDHGLDFCRAGFSGLQKGLQSTGAHVQSRPKVLPALNAPNLTTTTE